MTYRPRVAVDNTLSPRQRLDELERRWNEARARANASLRMFVAAADAAKLAGAGLREDLEVLQEIAEEATAAGVSLPVDKTP